MRKLAGTKGVPGPVVRGHLLNYPSYQYVNNFQVLVSSGLPLAEQRETIARGYDCRSWNPLSPVPLGRHAASLPLSAANGSRPLKVVTQTKHIKPAGQGALAHLLSSSFPLCPSSLHRAHSLTSPHQHYLPSPSVLFLPMQRSRASGGAAIASAGAAMRGARSAVKPVLGYRRWSTEIMTQDVLTVNNATRNVYIFKWMMPGTTVPKIFRFSVPVDSDKDSDINRLYRAVRGRELYIHVEWHDRNVKSWTMLAFPDVDDGRYVGYLTKCDIFFLDKRGVRYRSLNTRQSGALTFRARSIMSQR